MYHPTTRVLAVLELLQAHGRLSGPELAGRLEVDLRTVRRYVTMLQDLGIPVEAERGRYGGYRLRAGFKLPPVLVIDGIAVEGYQPERIDELLGTEPGPADADGTLACRPLGLSAADGRDVL